MSDPRKSAIQQAKSKISSGGTDHYDAHIGELARFYIRQKAKDGVATGEYGESEIPKVVVPAVIQARKGCFKIEAERD